MDRRSFLGSTLCLPAALCLPSAEALRVPHRRDLDLRLVAAELESPAAATMRCGGRTFIDLGRDNVARFEVDFPRTGWFRFELYYGADLIDRPPRAAVLLDRRVLGTTFWSRDHPSDATLSGRECSFADLGEHLIEAGPRSIEIETLFEEGEAIESLRISPVDRPVQTPRLRFVQLSDTHVQEGQYPVWMNRKIDGDMPEILAEVGVHLGRLRPDFVMHTGDIVDGDTPESIAFARDAMAGIPRPLYPILGNHDTYRKNHANWLSIWKEEFPGDQVYYSFDCNGWHVVMLDCLLNQSAPLRAPQSKWLDEDLAEHPKMPTIIAAHTPIGQTGEHPPLTEEILPRIQASPQVKLVLGGHTHRALRKTEDGRAYLVTAAMVEWPLVYREFLIYADGIEMRTYQVARKWQRKSFMEVEEKLAFRRKNRHRVMEMDKSLQNDMLGRNDEIATYLDRRYVTPTPDWSVG